MKLLRALGTALLALLAGWLLRLLRATWRVRVVGAPPADARLFVCWHGDLAALSVLGRFLRRRAPAMLVSKSKDGELGARLARQLGLEVVRGSTSRGALSGSLAMLRRLRAGGSVALAVDGPRGPRERAGDSALRLARVGGTTVAAVAAVATRAWHARSWDRHAIPAPFSRVVLVWQEEPVCDVESALSAVRGRAQALTTGGDTEQQVRDAA